MLRCLGRSITWLKGAGRAEDAGQTLHRSGCQFVQCQSVSGMLELTVDLQLNATDGEQRKACFRSARLHEIADLELPLPDIRRFRSRERIFYAFVIHGE